MLSEPGPLDWPQWLWNMPPQEQRAGWSRWLAGSLAPAVGSEYDLFTYTGAFGGSIKADIIASPAGWPTAKIFQGTGRIYLSFVLVLPGDTNEDGVVDAADYIALKQNFGQSTDAGAAAGDFNGNGTVDYEDLQTLMTNFGSTLPAPATTPEPGSVMLLMFGAAALFRRRRKA